MEAAKSLTLLDVISTCFDDVIFHVKQPESPSTNFFFLAFCLTIKMSLPLAATHAIYV